MNNIKKITLFRIITTSILLFVIIIFKLNDYLEFFIFIIAYLTISYDIIIKSFKNIIKGNFLDENFLMTIATFGAIALKEYSEAVAVMLFYQIGEAFLDYSVDKSKKSISELMDLKPDYVNIETNGEIIKTNPKDINVGDVVLVKPGEKVPLDGTVVFGTSALNTSALTGESLPKDVGVGDSVLSGSLNINGILRIKVTKPYSESTVTKILELVENSSAQKSKTENFITKFAAIYTPIVVACAIILAVIPPLIFNQPFGDWFERALIFLVISCPCALVVSIPMSFFGGIGGASKNGILVKGSGHVETLNKLKYVIFDKTGTLSKGNFVVAAVHPDKINKSELLEYAAFCEYYSNHPIAESIKRAYGKEIDKSQISSISEISGRGIKAVINDKQVLVGNNKLMEDYNIAWKPCKLIGTVVHISVDSDYSGHIIITDEIKSDAFDTVKKLREQGKRTVILTGDSKKIGDKTAKMLGVDEVHCKLLPNDKVGYVNKLKREVLNGEKIAFVGDGINDAPSLMLADVGIAMGALGSDAAIEAADVVIMNDNPYNIITALEIAKNTMAIVKQNVVLVLGIKMLVLFMGSLGLANMWEGVFADVGVTILAALNASRTFFHKKNKKD